ncbi:MAG: hypothetical protein IT328_04315 [Caldilineaceae bacterium]|nr:hypothetical protein [Caldilineaceae bacterium]
MVENGLDEHGGLYDFVGFGELAETTTQLLALNLHHTAQSGGERRSEPGQVETMVLQQARDYLHKVREGFVLSVRAGQIHDQSELRYLLDRVISDWSQLSHELGLAEPEESSASHTSASNGGTNKTGISSMSSSMATANRSGAESVPDKVERVRQQLLAFGMAVVALGHLPRLPSKQITFPHSYSTPPTYSDIPVPSTPGEMLWRIEELEQMVWRLMSDDLHDLVQRRYGSLRRTYGFFETSAWLSHKEAVRFGVKKAGSSLLGF